MANTELTTFDRYYTEYRQKSQTILTAKEKLKVHFQKRTETAMKTIKRLLWVLLGIVIAAVIGYFIYTGFQV